MYVLTYNLWIRDTKTSAGAIFGIHMEFALKWDETILCLDNFYIFKNFEIKTHIESMSGSSYMATGLFENNSLYFKI